MDTDTSTLSPNDNEPAITPSADTDNSPSAGAMLRTLREQAGMELETLGAALKVSTQRLHALESDDYSALPALYFARGLAANICRHLGQDAAPVLAKMPDGPPRMPTVQRKDSPMRPPVMLPIGMGSSFSKLYKWIIAGVGLLLLAVAAIFAIPRLWAQFTSSKPATVPTPAVAASIAQPSEPMTASTVIPSLTLQPAPTPRAPASISALPASTPVRTTASAPAAASVTASAPASAATPASGQQAAASNTLQINATGNTWVKVSTAAGRTLFERRLTAGQQRQIQVARYPVRVAVGNTEYTQIIDRGQPFDLAGIATQGSARFEIKP